MRIIKLQVALRCPQHFIIEGFLGADLIGFFGEPLPRDIKKSILERLALRLV